MKDKNLDSTGVEITGDGAEPLPFSEWCFVCGSDNSRGVRGRFCHSGLTVWLDVTLDEEFNGYPGVLHGGMTAGLLDETMGWVAALALDRMCKTAELNVRYIHSVPVGMPLRFVAEPVKINKRICTVKSHVYLVADEGIDDGLAPANEPLARATGKFMPMSKEETIDIDRQLIYDPDRPSVFGCCTCSEPTTGSGG
ncbi:MAG: PaaI family thioesterase [Candidatus Hydrogenedentes bacterium]|nr:PaaI family thioesterase [Candidatus Hydrogenedentota bacterium]